MYWTDELELIGHCPFVKGRTAMRPYFSEGSKFIKGDRQRRVCRKAKREQQSDDAESGFRHSFQNARAYAYGEGIILRRLDWN